jgi:hypothetical protein
MDGSNTEVRRMRRIADLLYRRSFFFFFLFQEDNGFCLGTFQNECKVVRQDALYSTPMGLYFHYDNAPLSLPWPLSCPLGVPSLINVPGLNEERNHLHATYSHLFSLQFFLVSIHDGIGRDDDHDDMDLNVRCV